VRDFGQTHHDFVRGQIRHMSPERGVLQLATAACLNAIWDMWAKVLKKPLWKLVVDLTPEELVATVPFQYIDDAITPQEAIEMLRAIDSGVGEREKIARDDRAIPGYSTSVGGLGTTDEQIEVLLKMAMDEGFHRFKLRLGLGIEKDRKRLAIIRRIAGPDAEILVSEKIELCSETHMLRQMQTSSGV
jgi:L-galactonate dehydratase